MRIVCNRLFFKRCEQITTGQQFKAYGVDSQHTDRTGEARAGGGKGDAAACQEDRREGVMDMTECPLPPQYRDRCAAWDSRRAARGEPGCGGVALGHTECHLTEEQIKAMKKETGGR